ncbi:tyrosine-protein phosphatase [Dysgonomonas sp. Marseille-P4677]|uniref:tyrosine-protein phosphatase n=1 Tax=Dysgonomonas sp. Marseille-P4677 TaxID=2364790 RepID=UPI0019126E1E|nr:tyrosine-protein phosphatase [Dysgonomonas sp. Marseille-P4677]MBK5721112.1 tyrosine-protein phosphatase [Dysgonomonas sp. Marseille-P4677]
MKLKLLVYIVGLTTLYNCSSKPSITALCEMDRNGNYILRWEIYPEIDNVPVEIFISDNDSLFPSIPNMTVNSNDYIAMIDNSSKTSGKRKYFRIKVAGAMSDIITNRFFELDSIQNFRDIGGYTTNDNRNIRWGRLFRSGSFSRMTPHDSTEIDNLGIKTIIDLRSEDVKRKRLDRYNCKNNIRIPISMKGYSSISQKVLDGKFLRGDAIIYTQDTYKDMVNNFAKEYASFFDYLCDEKNYPIVFHCYLGKDQTGLATYFLLRALDVPLDVIEDDYMISGIGIDRTKLIKDADSLSESRQEALTMLTKTDLTYLKYGISCIREKSGSVDDYMLNELKLTPEKRKKLRDILLH